LKFPAVFLGFLVLDFLPHPVAAAGDGDGLAVMQKTIKDGGGDGVVVVKYSRPVFVGFVGGEDDGASFIPFRLPDSAGK
jgi:hypothetical protein